MDLPKTKESVSVSMPSWLLEEIEDYCNRSDFSRSKLIVRAVRKYLLSKKDSPEFWSKIYQERTGLS